MPLCPPGRTAHGDSSTYSEEEELWEAANLPFRGPETTQDTPEVLSSL